MRNLDLNNFSHKKHQHSHDILRWPEPKEQASAQTITAVEGKESDKKEL